MPALFGILREYVVMIVFAARRPMSGSAFCSHSFCFELLYLGLALRQLVQQLLCGDREG